MAKYCRRHNSFFPLSSSYRNSQSKKIMNVLNDFDLEQLIHHPTHRSGNTLDWVVTPKGCDSVKTVTVDDGRVISDHFLVTIDLFLNKVKNQSKTVTSRKIKDITLADFQSDVKLSFSSNPVNVEANVFNDKLKTV